MSLKVPTAPTTKPRGSAPAAGSSAIFNGRVNASAARDGVNQTSRSAPTTTQKGPSADTTNHHHPFLSAAQVSRANAAFLNYCECQGQGMSSAGGVVVMSAKGVQAFLNDIGVVKTESEAKDIIFTLNQSAATQQRNKEAALALSLSTTESAAAAAVANTIQQEGGGDGGNTTRPIAPPPSGDIPTAKGQFLGFPLFLELLTSTFPQDHASRESELQRAFAVMDANGDEMISESDVRSLVQQLLVENPTNPSVRALAAMTKEQLSAAIAEADLDGDGQVTLDDFIRILTTA